MMNGKAGIMAAIAMAAMSSAFAQTGTREFEPHVDLEEMKEKERLRLLAKGVKEFTIDGITVQARNRKNAKRKVENIKRNAK